ncbi:putative membrane protein (GlpM family) [Actinoplanes octamycinicus]|uniref:Putative membrane protein (GlpM family) n=1 Tax=Actinoplanes octamycinicus TaxID=135948 RepID=A0A7W7H1J9_9ACTN|nr:DUF3147 family protein [Actinoplanes octamycinicus]MBB4742286.1 putative membrane protein (GlpM family) [Actinoplanes octamycinicus]GIE59869.1 hypothetical protein Aoc01nite_52710 [Actinoplanes octamycinicus]
MGRTVLEIVLKALAGGVLVLAFAALAQVLKPKRFAGIFAAAPSVALAGLIVTVLFSGDRDLPAAGAGMAVGAVGFVVYCLAAVPLIRRFGAWKGSGAALLAWGAVAAAGYAAVLA